MEKLIKLTKKFCTKEIIFYALFGVLTTIINVGTLFILSNYTPIEKNIANIISIIVAVLFAYFSNRKLVFNSKAITFKENFHEFIKFIIGRSFTMLVEACGFYLLFSICHIHELISKFTITIIVVILNFFISKFFAFKKTN